MRQDQAATPRDLEGGLAHAQRLALPESDRRSLRRPGNIAGLSPYPVDVEPLLTAQRILLDAQGVPYHPFPQQTDGAYQPATIAQHGLICWDAYLAGGDDADRESFLTQANWLLEHEVLAHAGMSCWPVPRARPVYAAPASSLCALTQGTVTSVLVRAHRLLGDSRYLEAARRAVRALGRDILDGGVASGEDRGAAFFEEVAVYPAAHILSGHLFALLGLHEYHTLTADPDAADLLARGHATLHSYLRDFDTGYWSRHDLLTRRLATPLYHALHVTQLQALAHLLDCARCAEQAARWHRDDEQRLHRLRAGATHYAHAVAEGVSRRVQRARFGPPAEPQAAERLRVCVPITAFPFQGGMRTIMTGMEAAMAGEWDIEYLTRVIGPDPGARTIVPFGWPLRGRLRFLSVPSNVPNVWLYGWLGRRMLRALVRRGPRYHVILAQDSVFTGAFAGRVGKRAGIRVVNMDHGNTAAIFGPQYRQERLQHIAALPWHTRSLERLRLVLYLWTARRLARGATRTADRVLAPSDQSERAYREHLGVPAHRIVRYAGMVDVERFAPARDDEQRQRVRERLGVEDGAAVLTLVGRLAPEKGLALAVPALAAALRETPAEQIGPVRIVIGGDGPLRDQLVADLERHGLTTCTTLLGELAPDAVAELLGVSDMFLYAGTRAGAGPQVVMEAMAAGCAVVASMQPPSVAELLAEGRGIAVEAGSVDALRDALVRCLRNRAQVRQMGQRAREHIAAHYTAQALRRSLLRATYFAPTITREGASAPATTSHDLRGSKDTV